MGNQKSLFFSFLFLCLFLSACSKAPDPLTAASVNANAVQAILQAPSKTQQDTCEAEINDSGAKILYRNDLGLLMTDKKISNLDLSRCKALASDNQPLPTANRKHSAPATKKTDLAELLRLIPANEIGARDFIKSNPTYDGRGAKVAILDTGLALDHPMLIKTSAGLDKVLAFEDFSGEGNVTTSPVNISDHTFTGTNGVKYQLNTSEKTVNFGVFAGSTLKYSEELSATDTFKDLGVVVYQTPQGLRGKIDTDGDGNFDNEIELYDFEKSRLFTHIGDKKSLTVSMNLAPGGKKVSLCFDDGAHGTHVSGISTGFDPEGLSGVAPGAQIILGKIGDNRLSGGSTTTASMMLAIDFAVRQKAQIINMSYGQDPGSNIGKSAIDQYVDLVAQKKGILFSISAGNEGPGLQTVGVPAGADFAIVNGAYISKATARLNYNFIGVEDDNIWFFSSVGPRLDGGLKPTLLAPGSAVSSVPGWSGGYASYRGTSMASPEVTGGLALILSAAIQSAIAIDRASITQAVYASATPVANLKWIEQGHGLMNVPKAFEALKGITTPPVDYAVSINSPSSPTGKGAGIYVRSRALPTDAYEVTLTPLLSTETNKIVPVAEAKLVASAPWIHVDDKLWLQAQPRTFLVSLDAEAVQEPGLYSEKISAFDQNSGAWMFDVPVTVITPSLLNDATGHTFNSSDSIAVGHTVRHFIDVPAGTTALSISLSTDGPVVWGQWVDPEGRTLKQLQDAEVTAPMPKLNATVKITKPGVYEIDLVAPTTNIQSATAKISVRAYSLDISANRETDTNFHFLVQNNFEPIKVTAKTAIASTSRKTLLKISGTSGSIPIPFTDADKKLYSEIGFTAVTSNTIYDLMTDYPYRIFDAEKNVVSSGGMAPFYQVTLPDAGTPLSSLPSGPLQFEIQGAFAVGIPNGWEVELTEVRKLKEPLPLAPDKRLTLATGQMLALAVDRTGADFTPESGFKACISLDLSEVGGNVIQNFPLCR